MKHVAAAAACALGALAGVAEAQTTRGQTSSYQFTALAAGGDNFKTVYYGKSVPAAVEVCTIDKPVHVRAHWGEAQNVSTLTGQNECVVVVAEKVTVTPYVVQEQSVTVHVRILGVAGIFNPNP